MKRNLGQIVVIGYIFIGFLLTMSVLAEGIPSIGEISVSPEHPAKQSDVTFTVDITGDDISSVRIIINECNKPLKICHAPPQNISMNNVDNDTYQAVVTLEWDDVTSITYHVIVKSNGEWTEYREHTTSLSIPSEESTGSNDSNGSNSTPGFETILFIIALISVVILSRKFKLK
jgi:hypothetical protein